MTSINQDVTVTIDQTIIEITVDDQNNFIDAQVSTETIVEATVSGSQQLANVGTGARVLQGVVNGLNSLRTLLSSNSTISISEVGDEIDFVLNGLGTLMQIYELKNSVKTETATYYTELPDEEEPSRIDIWTDSGKGTKLFTTLLTWTGGNATTIVNTDETTGKVLTTDLTYHPSGSVATITEVLT